MTILPIKQHTLELLHAMLGEQADFRPGQWEAIDTVAIQNKRALVVQRTAQHHFIFDYSLAGNHGCQNDH
jgi:hypothetical protein